MPEAGLEERLIYRVIAAKFRDLGHVVTVEYTVNTGRAPLRYRQIDLRIQLTDQPVEVWLEIDGPNHRGLRNVRRDRELAGLALERRVQLIHWPVWRVLDDGVDPIVKAVLSGETHYGHADGEVKGHHNRYRTFDARYW